MAQRADIQKEAKALDDRKLTEKARTARNSCTDWTRTHQEALDEPWIYTSDEEQAEIDSAKAAKDGWCMMAEVYEAELRQRRAERPTEVGATVDSVDRRRAEERHEREERYRDTLEEDLDKQRERSVIGAPGRAVKAVTDAFSPAKWVGLGADQTTEERTLGAVRLALIAGALVVAYYLLVRPTAGFAAAQTRQTGELFKKVMDQPIPGM